VRQPAQAQPRVARAAEAQQEAQQEALLQQALALAPAQALVLVPEPEQAAPHSNSWAREPNSLARVRAWARASALARVLDRSARALASALDSTSVRARDRSAQALLSWEAAKSQVGSLCWFEQQLQAAQGGWQ
jgi:hypothetical protein